MNSDDEALRTAYRHLLAVRFAEIARGVQARVPAIAASTGLSAAWATVARIPPGWLDVAVEQPELAAWVETGERLLEASVYDHYGWAHPRRHAEELSRLLLAWAHLAPHGTEGAARGRGRVVPLCFGSVVIRSAELRPAFPLHWRRIAEGLRVEMPDGEAFVPLGDPARTTARGAWEVRVLPQVEGVVVDIWSHATPSIAVLGPEAVNALASLAAWLRERSCALPPTLRRVVVRAGVTAPPPGALDVAHPRELTPARLERWETADLGARACALARWVDTDLQHKFDLDLTDALVRGGIDPSTLSVAARLLRKPRSSEGREADWSTVNAIGTLAPNTLTRLVNGPAAPDAEADCFVAAVAAYQLGRWREAAAALRACMRHDEGADPYRLLLAFTLRHLGERDASEALLFQKRLP